jgi:cytochrome c oxidase subunit IV
MSGRIISPATYVSVLVVLIALTCLTVGISFIPLGHDWHLGLGLLIAVIKASLVGLFFMHLVHSRASVWSVVFVALFWLLIVLGVLTFSDYATRAWFPYVPGH